MPLRCPTCNNSLDPTTLTCAKAHSFYEKNGVLVLLDTTLHEHWQPIFESLDRFRLNTDRQLLDPATYENLPYSQAKVNPAWRKRCADVSFVTRWLPAQQKVLDVGAWNGWLSHQLSLRGHQVTAIDYFSHPYDGLQAKQFYSTTWSAIQMDLTNLTVLDQTYDAVIMNHGLQFFPDPIHQVKQLQQKVRPNGILLFIDLPFFANPHARQQQVLTWEQNHQKQYGSNFWLRPTKGYLNWHDKQQLIQLGVRLHWPLWWSNLMTLLRPTWPRTYYGVWKRSAI